MNQYTFKARHTDSAKNEHTHTCFGATMMQALSGAHAAFKKLYNGYNFRVIEGKECN